ncbi:type 1 glutamine amidotransferase [Nocardioides sp. CPCC 205120]|uniref:type 1 glutamine amidotransferase n=1 Tax=Nocardioides sp. CPCC 205120 TaxID=3406462 RepID=UPI003B50AA90
MSRARLLVVQHQDDCPPARFETWLADAGCALDVRHAGDGDPLPADLADVDGLLVLGGSPGAYDDAVAPWLPAVRALVVDAESRGVPTLGICLGHQLAAVALGGSVARDPQGQTWGLTPVGWTAAAADDPLLAPVVAARPEARAVHWNNDVVTRLPAGATMLATGPGARVQAARLARSVWGVQLHPEADGGVVECWAAAEEPAHPARGVLGRDVLTAIDDAHDELGATWAPLAASLAHLAAQRAAAALTTASGVG